MRAYRQSSETETESETEDGEFRLLGGVARLIERRTVLARIKDDARRRRRSAALLGAFGILDPHCAPCGRDAAFTKRAKGNLMLKIYDTSLDLISLVKGSIGTIERHDGDLARQLRRALASVTLNIAEGSYARGRNRFALYQVALGSAKESRACLDVALRFGYVDSVDTRALSNLNVICAVLYKLVM